MIACEYCGALVAAGHFCSNCGTKLALPKSLSQEKPEELRHLTVLFCDLVGSTHLAECLEPEQYSQILKKYQNICSWIVNSYGGHVAQYLGDGLLVYFGYPVAHEDDSRRAVLAGLEILKSVVQAGSVGLKSPVPIAVRIGIHTGVAVAGEVGSGTTKENLVLGQAPNIAARLQARAEPGTIVVSDSLRRLIAGFFECRSLGRQKLPGLTEEIALYEVIGELTSSRYDAIAAKGLSPFVAREREIAILGRLWADAREGHFTSILIRGEPGVGKSRLTRRIIDFAEESAENCTICECSSFHENSTLFPVIELIRRHILQLNPSAPDGQLDMLEEFANERGLDRESAVPILGALLDIGMGGRRALPVMGPELLREETLKLLLAILRNITKPHLIVFEDLQWSDATTMELVRRLISGESVSGLMVVLTCRPELVLGWIKEVGSQELVVNRLDDDDVRELIGKIDSSGQLSREVVEAIIRTADGIPLFAEELTKTVLEAGARQALSSGGVLVKSQQLQLVPDSLEDSMISRLDRLGSGKEVAQLAAIIGRQFHLSLLLSISKVSETELRDGLKRLVSAGIVLEYGAHPASAFQFKHALVQLAAYNSVLRGTRQHIHARIVRSLEDNFTEVASADPELLAHHCELSGMVEKAIDYWMRAGQKAFAKSANIEAAAHFRKARSLLSDMPDQDNRAHRELQVLTMLGPSLIATAGFASKEVGEVYDVARKLCAASPGNPETFPALWGSWVYFLVKGELRSSREFAEEMLLLGERIQSPDFLVEARWALGNSHYWLGDMEAARKQLENAVAIYNPTQHASHALLFGQDPGVAAQCYLSFVYWMLGRPADSAASLAASEEIAKALDHPFTTAWPMAFHILLCSHHLDPVRGLKWAERLLKFSEEQKQQYWLQAAVIIRGWSRATLGETSEGIKEMRSGIAAYGATGAGVSLPHFHGLLAETLVDIASYNEADKELTRAFAAAHANGELASEVSLWRIKGKFLRKTMVSGSIEAPIDCYRNSLKIAEQCSAWAPGLRTANELHRLLAECAPDRLAGSPLHDMLKRFSADSVFRDLQEARHLVA